MQRDTPAPADAVGLVGILLALAGLLLVALRLAWLAWETWAWWSGLVFMGAGVGLFLAAALGAWLYTVGLPAARHRWDEYRHAVRQRREQRQQREAQQESQEGAQ